MSTDNTGQFDRPTQEVTVSVDGERVTKEVEPRLKLSDFLRQECDRRGVRVGCEHGVCGACTVDLDGDAVKSCLLYAVQADGRDVETVHGLADGDDLHPIQRAFHEEHALQCGFCTSGFVMATRELLAETPSPTREEMRVGLADNICRCTGYQNIFRAVDNAADALANGEFELADHGDLQPDGGCCGGGCGADAEGGR